MPIEPYRVQAYNTAKQSENKMHDDTVAKRFGFSGGLVPGVDVMAYMMHLPVDKWGGTAPLDWADEAASEYLRNIREADPIYAKEGLGHPGLLQRVMNRALVDNAILGPWIHAGSRMQLLSAAKSGDVITARAKVIGNYDKKGHRFVELDALVVANGQTPLAHCHHVAIYQPRE